MILNFPFTYSFNTTYFTRSHTRYSGLVEEENVEKKQLSKTWEQLWCSMRSLSHKSFRKQKHWFNILSWNMEDNQYVTFVSLFVSNDWNVVIDCDCIYWTVGPLKNNWQTMPGSWATIHRRFLKWVIRDKDYMTSHHPPFVVCSLTGAPKDALPPQIHSPNDLVVYEKEPGNYSCASEFQLDSLNYKE